MNSNTHHSAPELSDNSESTPDEHEQQEPDSPLHTATVPAVPNTSELHIGETGISAVVNMDAEGEDDAEAQDASLTTNETLSIQKRETDKAMTEHLSKDIPVLIVEDTVELAEVVQATLEGLGFEAVYETHGKAGLERLKAIHPQLVFLDIGLPDITGWQMLDQMKEYFGDPDDIPSIIVITAYGDPANRLIAKLQPIHSYLIKPFTPTEVEFLVDMVMRGEKPENPNFGGSPSA